MKPPFPLYAKSHTTPSLKKPWWMLTDIPFAGYLLYFRGPRKWLDDAFNADVPIVHNEFTGCHATLELNGAVCQVVWVGGEPEYWEDAVLAHELVHAADEVMDRHGYEGSEFRATLVGELLERIWATRNENGYQPNMPIPKQMKPVLQRLRRYEKSRGGK